MNLKKLRDKTGLTQAQFWTRIGITQSGGSRYESMNREPPSSVCILLNLAYSPEPTANRILRELRA